MDYYALFVYNSDYPQRNQSRGKGKRVAVKNVDGGQNVVWSSYAESLHLNRPLGGKTGTADSPFTVTGAIRGLGDSNGHPPMITLVEGGDRQISGMLFDAIETTATN